MSLQTTAPAEVRTPAEQEQVVLSGSAETTIYKRVCQMGFWSAVLLIASGAGFVIPMLIALLVPSILMPMLYLCLAFSLPSGVFYIALMVSIQASAPPEKKIWGQLGVAFTIIFATLMSINYYVQLTTVRQLGVHEGHSSCSL